MRRKSLGRASALRTDKTLARGLAAMIAWLALAPTAATPTSPSSSVLGFLEKPG